MGTRFKFFSCSFLILLPEYVKASALPELFKLASCYTTTTIGSYDVERSFSAYSEILDQKRRSLDQSTIIIL